MSEENGPIKKKVVRARKRKEISLPGTLGSIHNQARTLASPKGVSALVLPEDAGPVVLKFGEVTGQKRLPQQEEQEMADKGVDWVTEQLVNELVKLSKLDAIGFIVYGLDDRLLNSLIWIYVQMIQGRLKRNIAILIASSGCGTINGLARKAQLNSSFVGRLISMEVPGGWNVKNLFVLAQALEVGVASLLFADFKAAIEKEAQRSAQLNPTNEV